MSDPSTTQTARAWVEIRLDRLRANIRTVQHAVGAESALVPMIKADAYGLGALPLAAAIREELAPRGPWAFGVATLAEGEELRHAGFTDRVLIFSPLLPGEFRRAACAALTLCLSEISAIRELARVAAAMGRHLPFHLEIDTGMGRTGLPWDEASRWGPELLTAMGGWLRLEGIFTHFHSADAPGSGSTLEQWDRFRRARAELPALAPEPLIHVANSAATLRYHGFGCDLARPGIYLYGGCAGLAPEPQPVVSVCARLVRTRSVQPGATVGYGAVHRAATSERWGTLAIGYGDGIARALAEGGGRVLVRGRSVPIIGRISMDLLTIDLSGVPEARPGDRATLIGSDGAEWIGIDEVAARCGTISYEILTRLGKRLPRVYLDPERSPDRPGEAPARSDRDRAND